MTFAAAVFADSPELWWDTRQASGGVQPDRSGNGHAGTVVGSPGADADGLTFDPSTDQHIEGDDTFGPATYAEWALEAVVNIATLTSYQHIAGFASTGDDEITLGLIGVAPTVIQSAWFDTARHKNWVSSPPTPDLTDTGALHHFHAEYDGTDIVVYLDGTVYSTRAISGPGAIFAGAQAFYLGNDQFGIGDGTDGLIRHGIFYTHTLGATRVAAHAAALADDPVPGGGLDPPPAAPDPCIIDVVDIDGNVITNLPLAWCESITRTKNQPDEAVIHFPKYAYTRDDVHVFADDSGSGDLHEIRVMRSGNVRFWGPAVSADTNSDDGTVTLHCKGVDWYLTRRYIDGQRTNLLTNGSFETGDETGWTPIGAVDSEVTTDDAIRGTNSLRLASITPLGDIFESQTVSVTGTGVGTFVTVSAYFKIEGSLGGHAFDRRGLFIEGVVGSTVQTNNGFYLDEATAVGDWIRAKAGMQVPPFVTWDVNIRLYSPPGSILWDEVQLVAMQSVSTAGLTGSVSETVDVSAIVELIHNFVQDPTFGHSDVNIGLDNPTVGVKQVKHIQWADHVSWSNQMSEWLDRDDCFDYSVVYTETTRTLTLHVPQQGTDRRGDFTLTFPGNIASCAVTEDGGGTITDDTELDQDSGDGPDREEGHYADATQVGGLTLQAVNTAPQGAAVASLDPIAREQVNKARRPALLYTFTLTNKDGTDYDELLGLGDLVDFAVTNGWASTSGYGAIAQLVEYPRNRRLEVTLAKAM